MCCCGAIDTCLKLQAREPNVWLERVNIVVSYWINKDESLKLQLDKLRAKMECHQKQVLGRINHLFLHHDRYITMRLEYSTLDIQLLRPLAKSGKD